MSFNSKFHGKAADLTGENGGAREDVRQPEVKNVEGALSVYNENLS